MAFLHKDELKTVAPSDFVEIVLGTDSDVVEMIIAEMIDLIKTNIGSYYDAEQIFSKEGNQRSLTVLNYLKDLVWYKLLKRRKPQNLNEDEYNEAMKWLEDISTGKRKANLPAVMIDVDGDGAPDIENPFMKLGSRKNYGNNW